MRCIRVGHGTVAPLHEQKLVPCDVQTAGVIDIDVAKTQLLATRGYRICATYQEALELKPDFWDVCTPNDQHLSVIEKIIKVDPYANILVEKPVTNFRQLEELQKVLKDFRGKIVVNENYLSSQIADKMKEIAFIKLKLTVKTVIVEMDKNRTDDFKRGRYRAETVFGYEGTHMITILQRLGKQFTPQPTTVIDSHYEAIEIPEKLDMQGLVDISYTVDGVAVNLFTSMKGDIKHRFLPYCPEGTIEAQDTVTRYRIAAFEGVNSENEPVAVVGFYEPIKGFARSVGSVVVIKNGAVLEKYEPIDDDTMGRHLKRAVEYFKGTSENPCPLDLGIDTAKLLHTISGL